MNNLTPIPDYAEVMTLQVFMAAVDYGAFIPYDGDGYYATATHMDRTLNVWDVQPKSPAYTHIAWFNR